MPNIQLPNPALPEDITAALIQAVNGSSVPPPNASAGPIPVSGPTVYNYVVVSKVNGGFIPSASIVISNGPSALGPLAPLTINWTRNSNLKGSTYDIYRTVGGTTQGKIASNLPYNQVSYTDVGAVGDGSIPPSLNTSGVLASSPFWNSQTVSASGAGVISIPSGIVFINSPAAATLTIGTAIPGNPSNGGHDGLLLLILGVSAFAHTVTTPTNGINGNKHIATFGAAAGNYLNLVAFNGSWFALSQLGVTIS
jgi:hypothetical protein